MELQCYTPVLDTFSPGETLSVDTFLDLSDVSSGSTYSCTFTLIFSSVTSGTLDVVVSDNTSTLNSTSGLVVSSKSTYSHTLTGMTTVPVSCVTISITNNTTQTATLSSAYFTVLDYDSSLESYGTLPTKTDPTSVTPGTLADVTDGNPTTYTTISDDSLDGTFFFPSDITALSKVTMERSGDDPLVAHIRRATGPYLYAIKYPSEEFPIYLSILPYIAGSSAFVDYYTEYTKTTNILEVYLNTNSSGTACSYAVSPLSFSFDESGGSGTISVATSSFCAWTATSSVSWISFTSGTSGSGNATVSFYVTTNVDSSPREGYITLGGKTVHISQNGATSSSPGNDALAEQAIFCLAQIGSGGSISVVPGNLQYTHSGGSQNLTIVADASLLWTVSCSAPWISFDKSSGSGNDTVSVTAAARTEDSGRNAFILINDLIIPVVQQGGDGTYVVSIYPEEIVVPGAGETLGFYVACVNSFTWTPLSLVSWVEVGSGGTGSGNFSALVSANSSLGDRSGEIYVDSASATITQSALPGAGDYDANADDSSIYGLFDADVDMSKIMIRVKTDEFEVTTEDSSGWKEARGWKNIWEEK